MKKNLKNTKKVKFNKQIPLKILRLKRPKWKFLHSYLLKLLRRKRKRKRYNPRYTYRFKYRFCFSDPVIPRIPFKRPYRMSKTFKFALKTVNTFRFIYKTKSPVNFIKKSTLLEKKYIYLYMSPLYEIKNLLYLIRLFITYRSCIKFVEQRNVVLNNVVVKSSLKLLKKGDLIKLIEPLSLNNLVTRSRKITPYFLSHVEFDSYSQCLCIVKDINELTKKDLRLAVFEKFKLSHIK